jgi:hypothetical protein
LANTIAKIAASIGKSVAGITVYLGKALSEIMPEILAKLNFDIGSLSLLLPFPYNTIVKFSWELYEIIKKKGKDTYSKIAESVTKIAALTGLNYDDMMSKVYLQVQKVSKQLQLGAPTLMLILEDTRTKTMAANNLMGRGFDLTQISWLKDMSIILTRIGKDVMRYKERPWNLLKDIDGWIIRKVIDTSAKSQQFDSTALEKLAEVLKVAAGQLETVRDKLDKHIDKLPGFIKDKLKPEIDKVNKTIDKFIDHTYGPALKTVNNSIDGLKTYDQDLDASILSILKRIKYPGNYLTEIDALSADEKLDQEEKVSNVSGRILGYDTKDFKDQSQKARDRLSESRDRLKKKLPPPPWEIGEEKLPKRMAGEKASLRDTWFVGEY